MTETTNEAALKLAREIIELSSHEPPIEGLCRVERIALAAILEVTERAAVAMENLAFFTPVEELVGMTKQEMSVRTCHAGAAALRKMEHLS